MVERGWEGGEKWEKPNWSACLAWFPMIWMVLSKWVFRDEGFGGKVGRECGFGGREPEIFCRKHDKWFWRLVKGFCEIGFAVSGGLGF